MLGNSDVFLFFNNTFTDTATDVKSTKYPIITITERKQCIETENIKIIVNRQITDEAVQHIVNCEWDKVKYKGDLVITYNDGSTVFFTSKTIHAVHTKSDIIITVCLKDHLSAVSDKPVDVIELESNAFYRLNRTDIELLHKQEPSEIKLPEDYKPDYRTESDFFQLQNGLIYFRGRYWYKKQIAHDYIKDGLWTGWFWRGYCLNSKEAFQRLEKYHLLHDAYSALGDEFFKLVNSDIYYAFINGHYLCFTNTGEIKKDIMFTPIKGMGSYQIWYDTFTVIFYADLEQQG